MPLGRVWKGWHVMLVLTAFSSAFFAVTTIVFHLLVREGVRRFQSLLEELRKIAEEVPQREGEGVDDYELRLLRVLRRRVPSFTRH